MNTTVRPLRFTDRIGAMRDFLIVLGLAPRIEAKSGDWVDLVAGTGMVALHPAARSDSGGHPGETRLSFETPDVDSLTEALRHAGFGEASRWDEAYGRAMSVTDPLGARLWIDERGDDYGYRRHRPSRNQRVHVLPLRTATPPGPYATFLGVLGLHPRAGGCERWQVLEGAGGRVALRPPVDDAAPDPVAGVALMIETTEPLESLVARLHRAGHDDAAIRHEEFGDAVLVTDPDGQRITCHPAPYTIRSGVPGDAPGLHQLGHRVIPDTYRPIVGEEYVRHVLASWWEPEHLRNSLRRTTTFVAESGGELIGTANLGRGEEGDPVLWKLYIDPRWQGHGVGSALLAAVLDATPPDADRLVLEHTAGNEPAAEFYRRRGFLPLATRPDPDGWPDQVWLQLPLH